MGLARGLASPPAALLAGALQALSIAEPWRGAPLWWLQTLSLAWLVWQLAHRAATAGPLVGQPPIFQPSR